MERFEDFRSEVVAKKGTCQASTWESALGGNQWPLDGKIISCHVCKDWILRLWRKNGEYSLCDVHTQCCGATSKETIHIYNTTDPDGSIKNRSTWKIKYSLADFANKPLALLSIYVECSCLITQMDVPDAFIPAMLAMHVFWLITCQSIMSRHRDREM